MKIPFLKSLNGKFALRTALIALVIAIVIGGLAIMRMRSLASTATDSVNNASASADSETLASLQALADDVSSASSSLTMIVIIVALLGALAAGLLALAFARKVTAPLVLLTNATKASNKVIPEIADAFANGRELPSLPAIGLSTGDELEDLADSIDYLQRTAANIAVAERPDLPVRGMSEPAATEVAVDETPVAAQAATPIDDKLIDLGGRSHELVASQMKFIEEMERDEANPANLQRLFHVDHLATRIRRNAESFLVLADKQSPRTLSRPVTMHQVVQAASGEIEHFDRISISNIVGASVDGAVATDLAHLLAELLENATRFTPEGVMTAVGGRPTDHGYLIDIIDHGQGMTAEAIEAANARFREGSTLGAQAPEGIGHEVVARLAQRHGVALKLSATPTGGLTAQVHVPHAALASSSEPQAGATLPSETPQADVSAAAIATHVDTAATDVSAAAIDVPVTEALVADVDVSAPAPLAAPEASAAGLGAGGLTAGQQAAMDWAIEQGLPEASNEGVAMPAPDSSEVDLLAAAMASTELSAGPADAAAMVDFDSAAAAASDLNLSADHNLSR